MTIMHRQEPQIHRKLISLEWNENWNKFVPRKTELVRRNFLVRSLRCRLHCPHKLLILSLAVSFAESKVQWRELTFALFILWVSCLCWCECGPLHLEKLGKPRFDKAKTNSKERMGPASWDPQRGSNQSVGGYEVLPFLMSAQKDRDFTGARTRWKH